MLMVKHLLQESSLLDLLKRSSNLAHALAINLEAGLTGLEADARRHLHCLFGSLRVVVVVLLDDEQEARLLCLTILAVRLDEWHER